ncbi:MAG: DUF87 domain-containing protein [Oscillospiraceae bacterium]|jgi:DNA helicase HerA-like ATPase|nr:DUF87 domain-containing protein [Oscillospiraceae bacterium]
MKNTELKKIQKNEITLKSGLEYSRYYINNEYLKDISVFNIEKPIVSETFYQDLGLFSVDKITLNTEENIFEKLTSVYSALNNTGLSFVILVQADKSGVNLYLGVKNNAEYSTAVAKDILKKSFNGNFGGCHLNPLNNENQKQLLNNIDKNIQNIASVSVVPSLRENKNENIDFIQGMEKFIDALDGEEYTAIFIAEPLSKNEISMRKQGFENLATTFSHLEETTLTYSKSESRAISDGVQSNFTASINDSISNAKGGSESQGNSITSTKSSSYNSGHTVSQGTSDSYSNNTSYGSPMFGTSGSSESTNYNSGTSNTTGKSSTYSDGKTQSYTTSENWSQTVTAGTGNTKGGGNNINTTDTQSDSTTISIKHTDRYVQDIVKEIDCQIERLTECESFGAWETAVYFISPDPATAVTAANIYNSSVIGDKTNANSYINFWGYSENTVSEQNQKNLLTSLKSFQHPMINLPKKGDFIAQQISTSITLTGRELPIMLSLPRKSVKGVVVDETAEFGKNIVYNIGKEKSEKTIDIGNIINLNNISQTPVEIPVNSFNSHCFVCGSTGSGKSNTVYTLLEKFIDNNINFTVIEPVKGEYKEQFSELDNVNIFWTISEKYKLLRINPFSFPPAIHVLEHIDRLINVFSACWALYSTQPFLLKSAIEKSYISCGWDLISNKHFNVSKFEYPNFTILEKNIEEVINSTRYKAESKEEFKGALLTRISTLTNGINGLVLNSGLEIDDDILFDSRTIIDLSRIGSDETRALLMGILVMKLNEHRINQKQNNEIKSNSDLIHITILEEAHNLLKKTSTLQNTENSNVVGKAVEMLTNSIAEMRTYGEGFIIVDQSPTSVDIAAIKNTNTKIIMNLPLEEDYLLAGKSISLDEKQILEIPKLSVGQAIIKNSNWVTAVKTQINKTSDNYINKNNATTESDLKSVLMPFINEVLRQINSKKESPELFQYNDIFIERIFKSKNVAYSEKDILMSYYKQAKEAVAKGNFGKDAEAEFVINVVGCYGLSLIFDISTGREKWNRKIYNALDEYVTTDDIKEKHFIATSLIRVAGYINKQENYVEYLKKSQQK